MTDYNQPSFYRFNSDSIELINWVFSRCPKPESILDLGAGCGIIGIELSKKYQTKNLTLIEVQEVFHSYLVQNVALFIPEVNIDIHILSFKKFVPLRSYDLIVSNPPFYLKGHGNLSKNESRAISRSFLIDDWKIFASLIQKSLSHKGRAIFTVKNQKDILLEINKAFTPLEMKIKTFDLKGNKIFEVVKIE